MPGRAGGGSGNRGDSPDEAVSTPVGENTHETTGLDRCFHLILRKVGKPKALERRVLYPLRWC